MAAPQYGQIIADMLNAERYEKTAAALNSQYHVYRQRKAAPWRDPANIAYSAIPAMPDTDSIERGRAYRSTYRLHHTPRNISLPPLEMPPDAIACYLMHEQRNGVVYYWWDYLVKC